MKKIFTLSAFAFIALSMNAQVFWTETFGTGCNHAQLASAFTGSNGAWTVATTGTNDNYADFWYVSSSASNNGVGNCTTYCPTQPNPTLHVGNADLSSFGIRADTGSTYLTGQFCSSFSICSTTHKRVQSPTINCTSKNNISISFVYYQGGEAGQDAATLVYSADGGTTWSNVNLMAQAGNTGCTAPFGKMTSYTVALPASANNNANVKIGFNWTNDNDAVGGDPSFAVDNITLSQSPTGINEEIAASLNIYSADNSNIIIKTDNVYKLIAVTDILGNNVRFTQLENTISVGDHSTGIYFVQVEIEGVRYTKKVMLQ